MADQTDGAVVIAQLNVAFRRYGDTIFCCRWRGEPRPLVVRRVLSVRRAHYQLQLPFRMLMF